MAGVKLHPYQALSLYWRLLEFYRSDTCRVLAVGHYKTRETMSQSGGGEPRYCRYACGCAARMELTEEKLVSEFR